MRTRSIFYRTCGHRYHCRFAVDQMSELHAEWLRNSDCESCRMKGYVDSGYTSEIPGTGLSLSILIPEDDRAWREQWEPSAGHLPKYVLQYLRPELAMDEHEAATAALPSTVGAAMLWLAENDRL